MFDSTAIAAFEANQIFNCRQAMLNEIKGTPKNICCQYIFMKNVSLELSLPTTSESLIVLLVVSFPTYLLIIKTLSPNGANVACSGFRQSLRDSNTYTFEATSTLSNGNNPSIRIPLDVYTEQLYSSGGFFASARCLLCPPLL